MTLDGRWYVAASITRWVSDEPQPGLVECRFTDVSGRECVFIDKDPIFTKAILTADSRYPQPGVVLCEIILRSRDHGGRDVADIKTIWSESPNEERHFRVFAAQLLDENATEAFLSGFS